MSTADDSRTWAEILEVWQSADPDELAARMPAAPRTERLIAAFPELARIDATDVVVDGPHGDVPVRCYRDRRRGDAAPIAALVWVHGGGFLGGDLDMAEAHWVGLMLAARGFRVLSVDYRKCLSGVHFPVPSDDVLAAWHWAVEHAPPSSVFARAVCTSVGRAPAPTWPQVSRSGFGTGRAGCRLRSCCATRSFTLTCRRSTRRCGRPS